MRYMSRWFDSSFNTYFFISLLFSSRAKQPQLLVFPVRSRCPKTTVSFPQSQRHFQRGFLFLSFSARSITTNRPKRCPVKSISLPAKSPPINSPVVEVPRASVTRSRPPPLYKELGALNASLLHSVDTQSGHSVVGVSPSRAFNYAGAAR